MSLDQSYPFPQVFLVDGGAQSSEQPPALIPCWPYPPGPRQRPRGREKSRGCMGISPGLAMMVLLLFLLVFAALGFEAYQIYKMQSELKQIRTEQENPEAVFSSPQKQIGFREPGMHGDDTREESRSAAHVIGRIEKEGRFSQTLRWESRSSRCFMSGGVSYHEDGALQVNSSGLYHVYSRVELILKSCSPSSWFTHSVFVRRAGHAQPLTLMKAHRAGVCSGELQHSRELQHSWATDSYLGSALKLQKHDRVYVNLTQARYLSHEHYANFFGLYKV